MYTTTDENGILNNYAPEATVYVAEYPTEDEQRRYALQGAIATLIVGFLILTSFSVS